MIGLLLSIILLFVGIHLLQTKLGTSQRELNNMFAGAALFAVVKDLTMLIILIFTGFSLAGAGGILLSLLIDCAFSYYFLKQSNLL